MIDWIKSHLVDDAGRAWRWFSVQSMGASVALLGAWEYLPADLKTAIPDGYVKAAAVGLLVLGLVGRLFKQGPKE